MLEMLSPARPGYVAYRHEGSFDRAPLTVTYLLDVEEHDSRRAAGLEAVTDEFALAGLLTLPGTTLGRVEGKFARVLEGCPAVSLVQDPDGQLWGQSLIRPPVEVLEIELTASWRAGFAAAQRWVGYGPRLVRTDDSLDAFQLTKASHYGIGVVDTSGERKLAPAYRPQRWTSVRWRFAEVVYSQFLALRG